MPIKCAECQCALQDCRRVDAYQRCELCTKVVCCCATLHSRKKSMSMLNVELVAMKDNCCARGICKDDAIAKTTIPKKPGLIKFFKHAKALYAAALGIEILCIAAAEIGENAGLYLFGFNFVGIPIAYAMGYALAGFTTFATILGRYNYGSNDKIDSCCSVLEQGAGTDFISNLETMFRNFAVGISKMTQLHKQPNLNIF